MNYLDLLRKSYTQTGNAVCLGLDPVLEAVPSRYRQKGILGMGDYLTDLMAAIKKEGFIPAAFKPNQGYYLRYDKPFSGDFSGSIVLAAVITVIRDLFPGIPIILDSKRGDISSSSANYATEAFDVWTCDAVTVSPYMGNDSVIPFLSGGAQHGGTYVLNRTSNPGAADFQNLSLGEKCLYEWVAGKIIEWNGAFPGTGAVVGATSRTELSIIAKKYSVHAVPMLIPGVGSQGGNLIDVLATLTESGYEIALARINSSSGITHPWAKRKIAAPADWQKESLPALESMIAPFRSVK